MSEFIRVGKLKRGRMGDAPVHLGLPVDDPEGWKSGINKARAAATSI